MAMQKLQWTFPKGEWHFIRLDYTTVIVVGFLVLIFSWIQSGSFLVGLGLTGIFAGVYFFTSYVIQLIRDASEQYHLTSQHLHVTRKTRFISKKEKVPLKDIHFHKLDRFLLGGYVLSKQGKHLVFFNTREELEKFNDILRRHSKSRA